MKNITTICVFLISLGVFAQEAGKVGELLKNEANAKQMKSERSSETLIRYEARPENRNYRNRGRNNQPKTRVNSNGRWNRTYGNSEVFLRIPEHGFFTVELGDQMISNANGKFRFFDLRNGIMPISIYENNYLIYRTRLNVRNTTRTVLDFFPDYGLYLLGNYPLQKQAYGFDEWDDIWNDPYFNYNDSWSGNSGHYRNVMNNYDFEEFISSIKRNANFDSDKVAMISSVARNTYFNADQIRSILKTLSFDKDKLKVAKELYARCVDRQNYYLVYDAFDFDSSKRELSEFVSRS